jgi:hypothetical protein
MPHHFCFVRRNINQKSIRDHSHQISKGNVCLTRSACQKRTLNLSFNKLLLLPDDVVEPVRSLKVAEMF